MMEKTAGDRAVRRPHECTSWITNIEGNFSLGSETPQKNGHEVAIPGATLSVLTELAPFDRSAASP